MSYLQSRWVRTKLWSTYDLTSHIYLLVHVISICFLELKLPAKKKPKKRPRVSLVTLLTNTLYAYLLSIHLFLFIHCLLSSTFPLECSYRIICPFLCYISICPDHSSIYILCIHRTSPMRKMSSSKSQNLCIRLSLLMFFHQLQLS